MTKTAKDKLDKEVLLFKEAQTSKNHDLCILHLGRAHIISQQSAWSHLYVHFIMFAYAAEKADLKEILGQTLRIFVTLPGHLIGGVPKGNIGWSTVGLTSEAPVPEDLQNLS
jgi:hypothetical protein